MALIRSKLHLAFPKSFIKSFSLPFSTVLESPKNPNCSQNEKETNEIDANISSNITPQQNPIVKGLNSLIKDHHKENPKFSIPYDTSREYEIDANIIPSLAQSFSQITPGECISPSVVLSVLKKCRYARPRIPYYQALTFFNWAVSWDNFEIYKQSFVEMVDLLGKADRFDLACGFIEEMRRRKLEIPSELFVRLLRRKFKHYNISCYGAFNSMEEYGCSLDKAAISVVIAMFVKKKQAVEAQSFFDKLKDICELDVVDYNNLIKGWCSVHKISKAARVFAEMKKTGIVPNVSTYNVFIDGLCSHCQITRAERVFSVMIEKGCQPNAASFNNFLSYYVKFGTTEKILEVYNQMKRFGCEPDVTTYNCLIACYCRDVENRDDAVKLIDEMVNKGIVPNAHSFNPIFNCISQVGDMNAADTLYAKMKELKCQPNTVTFNVLLRMFVEFKSTDMVFKLEEEMCELDVEPNAKTYKILISVLCAIGDWSDACLFFEDMLECTYLRPLVDVYEAYGMVLKELRIADQTKKHEELVAMMKKYVK
ncbi:pentatricopeptide repeat-containing protein At1g20300, mitochondrial-like [Silene latifolia]|uniref:pentatricopeptide repeat-containing protein At1g20300, mitochondrial-like n=1 Tax=Silene latifolia TaxID=37657 RepID=UPI003D776520